MQVQHAERCLIFVLDVCVHTGDTTLATTYRARTLFLPYPGELNDLYKKICDLELVETRLGNI